MRYFLTHITSFSWLVGILLSVVTLSLWIPDFISISASAIPFVVSTLLLTIINAVLLMYLIYITGITRTRTPLPIYIYMTLVGSLPVLHTQWESQLSVLVLQIILIILHNSFRNPSAVEASFVSTLLLALTSLWQPDVVFLLVFVWIGFSIQRSFSLKVMLASLIAIAVFTIYVFLFRWFAPDLFAVVSLPEAFSRCLVGSGMWLPMSYVALSAVVFVVMSFAGFTRENTHAQSLVLFLTIILVFAGVLMLFPPLFFSSLMSVAAYAVAGLAAYLFCARQSVAVGVIFILFITISIATSVLQLYI